MTHCWEVTPSSGRLSGLVGPPGGRPIGLDGADEQLYVVHPGPSQRGFPEKKNTWTNIAGTSCTIEVGVLTLTYRGYWVAIDYGIDLDFELAVLETLTLRLVKWSDHFSRRMDSLGEQGEENGSAVVRVEPRLESGAPGVDESPKVPRRDSRALARLQQISLNCILHNPLYNS